MIKRIKCIVAVIIAMIVGVAFSVAVPMEVSAATKTPAKVTVTAAKSTDYNTVKITWKKASGAKKYEVYRATSKNGIYKKQITTSKLSYTNSNLTTGKKYYYKVRAVNGKKKGKFSSVKSAVPVLKNVTAFKVASQSYSSCKISWAKVNGAKEYQLYRSTSNKSGSFKLIKTTSERSYTNTKLTTGKKYYYKVRAVRGTQKGAFSSVKSAAPTLNQAKGLSVEASSYTSSHITWNKVSGADGYKLYRAASKSGTYSLIRTTKETAFENVNLTQGKTYYYKVKAYRTVSGEKLYSAYSEVKSIYMQPREDATQFTYTVSSSDEIIVENKIFSKDVTINGDNGKITFVNCEINSDITLTAKEGTKVLLLDGTTVGDQCILDNGMKEGDFYETSLPKFITQTSIDVITEDDCYGAAFVFGDTKITFNGVEYDKADCDYYFTGVELVEYAGQTAEYYGVVQVWKEGVRELTVFCE